MKFCFSPINLPYVNLMINTAKKLEGEKGKVFCFVWGHVSQWGEFQGEKFQLKKKNLFSEELMMPKMWPAWETWQVPGDMGTESQELAFHSLD